MRRLTLAAILACLSMFLALPAHAQCAGPYSITSRQPISCLPYSTNGIFNTQLPNAGSGGPNKSTQVVLSQRGNTGAVIAKTTLTNNTAVPDANYGFSVVGTPGDGDSTGVPLYYGNSADPYYKVTLCFNACTNYAGTSSINTTWHIPNQAQFANPNTVGGDNFFLVWDQTNDKVLGAYRSNLVTEADTTLQNCTAATPETACAMIDLGWGQEGVFTTDFDYKHASSAFNTLYNSVYSLIVRHDELVAGLINHAVYINVDCVGDESANDQKFPASQMSGGHPSRCDTSSSPWSGYGAVRPKTGQLLFLDYTEAQIDGMGLAPWQETLVRAMTYYGGYVGDTFLTGLPDNQASVNIARWESGEAYELGGGARSGFYAYLDDAPNNLTCVTGGTSDCRYFLPWASGIPDLTGPNCTVTPCGVEDHIWIADECVPLGMAGLMGGCFTPPASGTITVIVPTSSTVYTQPNNINVHWSSTGITGNVDLEYSFNSGLTWHSIATVAYNSSPYIWTPAGVGTSTALQVRISQGAATDTSGVFSVIGQYTK